ncbi:MAG: right-handed parallel beta-helix repeat-containing protein [Clostridia bacterium]|nr:right-handed parallel beta-helix repeat-containing protein [Clostridia bacterium]
MKHSKRAVVLLIVLTMMLSPSWLVSCSGRNDGLHEEKPESAGKSFFVSPDGDDSNDGSAENPFATIEGAKSAVQGYKAEHGLPEGGIEVLFLPGTYRVKSQIMFSADDSGEDGKPVVYRAMEGGEVIFDGGVTIDPSLFVPASEDVRSRLLSDEAKANVLEVDLKLAGCYDLDDSSEYTVGWRCYKYRQELYVDNEKQNVARWPDDGYVTDAIYSDGGKSAHIEIPSDKADLWAGENVRYYGYTVYEWSPSNIPSMCISTDPESSCLLFSDTGIYEVDGVKTASYYLYNMLCELDSPGEYFWDVDAGKLYYYPDGELKDSKISFSQLSEDLLYFADASYLEFIGFTFENTRAGIFAGNTGTVDSVHHITIDDCVFRDLGGYAVLLGGSNICITGCKMYNLGSGCIRLGGGDPNRVLASSNVISGCLFHDWAQTYTVGNPACDIQGHGALVSHNEMFNCPDSAIDYKCSGTVFEYNYIHDVCTETSDSGAIYAGRRWDWNGNILRYNLIENITDPVFDGEPNGIYFDDCLSGQTCYGNVFRNISGCVFLVGGGKNHVIVNNIIIGPFRRSVFCDERGVGSDFMSSVATYPQGYLWENVKGRVNYLSDMQRFAVPENLLHIENSGSSHIERPDDPGTPSYLIVRDNIIVGDRYGLTDEIVHGTVESNILYQDDPGFRDPENGDYTLKEDSRVLRDIPGFINTDLSKIGIQK